MAHACKALNGLLDGDQLLSKPANLSLCRGLRMLRGIYLITKLRDRFNTKMSPDMTMNIDLKSRTDSTRICV